MKRCFILISFLFIIVMIIPIIIISRSESNDEQNNNSMGSNSLIKQGHSINHSVNDSSFEDTFKIKDEASGEIINVSDRDFTYGVVAAEMPISYEPEALKAQAVAAYTYYSKKRSEARANPDNNINDGEDFSNNINGVQIYLTQDQIKDRFKDNFDTYWNKLQNCVDSVYKEVLCEDDELITATFYAISSGKTEASSDIFGGEKNYLVAVPSSWDMYAPGYCTTVTLSPDEFKNTAISYLGNINFPSDYQNWVLNPSKTDSGSIMKIQLGDQEFTGSEVRSAFSLRSSNFDIVFDGDNFIFTVRGYGHGVGMSQYGAQYMAKQGSNYKQILNWYYPNTSIAKL